MELDDREGRDAAGVGPYARERERLTPLSSMDSWTVSEGEPDIRGWEIRTVSNRQLGTVSDLLIDREAGEVVLVDVDLPGTDRHTFVPIRVVQLDRARRVVLMDSADLPDSDLGDDRSIDREIVSSRAMLADAAPRPDLLPTRDASAEDPLVERRRGDRRRIDRLSSDL